MIAALKEGYVDYVVYMGLTERYPLWFVDEVIDDITMDENRYTSWIPANERPWDYHEKTLVEDYSVFIRKDDGGIFCTDYDVFESLYTIFLYNAFDNSGVAAFSDDCITYVECQPGVLSAEYPDWFYEYFTEAVHFPDQHESIFIYDIGATNPPLSSSSRYIIEPLNSDIGQIAVDKHCVFLRNHLGEIRHMEYEDFLKFYHPGPYMYEYQKILSDIMSESDIL